jgi:hypothetical protein
MSEDLDVEIVYQYSRVAYPAAGVDKIKGFEAGPNATLSARIRRLEANDCAPVATLRNPNGGASVRVVRIGDDLYRTVCKPGSIERGGWSPSLARFPCRPAQGQPRPGPQHRLSTDL